MKLIGTEMGRLAVFFPAEQIRPIQGVHPLTIINAVKERYSFQYSPGPTQPWEEIQREGITFRLGKFLREGRDVAINELGLYTDGIVVTALTTDDAVAFFEDLIDWARKTFGYRAFATEPRRIFASQILVRFEVAINHLIGKYEEITSLMSSVANRTYNLKLPYEIQGIGFDYDHLTAPVMYDLVRFVIERRVRTTFEQELFWCQAPLPTSAHIESLESIENILMTNNVPKR